MAKSNEVYVLWGGNDSEHDGHVHLIKKCMIESPASAQQLTVGTRITTKPWKDRKWKGVIVSAETAAALKGRAKRKKTTTNKKQQPKKGKVNTISYF